MQMAYARGADRIWVVNVGDLKPLEVPINHFLDMAYDARRWGPDSTQDWAAAWAAREFRSGAAADIADIMMKFAMYANRRKFELVEPQVYSVINYNEADAILGQWAKLAGQAEAVYDKLDSADQPAFFQMVLHPILAGQIVHKIYIGAAKNQLYAGQKRNSANDMISSVLQSSNDDANLTIRWDQMLDGKWKHMMDRKSRAAFSNLVERTTPNICIETHLGYDGYWQQPMRNTLPSMTYVLTAFVSLAGHVGVGVEGLNATVQGDDKYHSNSGNYLMLPPMDQYGPSTRYFDVFSRGTNSCTWTASPWQPWVKLSQSTGTVGPGGGKDTRVYVSIDLANAKNSTVNINITTPCRSFDKYGYAAPMVQVPVVVRSLPSSFTSGFVEADGHVAIEGPHYAAIVPPASSANASAGNNITYLTFTNCGRTSGGVGLWPPGTEKLTVDSAPALEYNMYLFSNSSAANVTVYISPTHNYLGDQTPLEYGIAMYPSGGAAPKPTMVRPVGPTVGQNLPDGWGFAVADGVWGRTGNYTTSSFKVGAPGPYTLRIWALMPSIIVQKIIVDMGGVRPSFLGPPESFLAGRDKIGSYNGTSFVDGLAVQDGAAKARI